MDPSIMKLLEEDEDESMHSGADVAAFTAALNRDIEGHPSSPQRSDSGSSNIYPMWQQSSHDMNNNHAVHDIKNMEHQMQCSSEMNVNQYAPGTGSGQQMANAPNTQSEHLLQHNQAQEKSQEIKLEQQHPFQLSQSSSMPMSGMGSSQVHELGKMPNPSNEAQFSNIQKFSSQPAPSSEQANNPANRSRQIPFGTLLPSILPELDKDRAMQLQTLYNKLRKNEVAKEDFVRLMRGIVGDHMLKVAVVKTQTKMAREPQPRPSQMQLHQQNQLQRQHPLIRPRAGDPYTFAHRQNAPLDQAMSQTVDNNSHSLQGFSKQQQQNLQFPPTSLPMYGSSSYHPFAVSNVNASTAVVKSQPHDSLPRHPQIPQSFGQASMGGATQPLGVMGASNFERPNSFNDIKRMPGGSVPLVPGGSGGQQGLHRQPSNEEHKIGPTPSMSYVKQESLDHANEQMHKPPYSSLQGPASFGVKTEPGSSGPANSNDDAVEKHPPQLGSANNFGSSTVTAPPNADLQGVQSGPQAPSPSTTVTPGSNTKTPAKKVSVGQKKPLDTVGSSPPLPSKKQKVTGGLQDQSIEQLNDVTAVSGVNLREEEEQLFSMPKDESRASEASRKVVQEEEEKLLLQKLPLQRKLAQIMSRCGLKNLSNDVERCLSLCVEERLRGLVTGMIRISRQRVDTEKLRHRTVVTSDVRQQILAINQKAKEDWDKKQAEADKLRRLNEPNSSSGTEADKEKEENRAKSLKANKEEDDKMRATAANVAARAAVGGDDMLSKWQLMAEQARQKREGGSGADGAGSSETARKPTSTTLRSKGGAKRDQLGSARSGALRGRNQPIIHHPGPDRNNISLKDMISVLEREPQSAKSAMLYRLYEKVDAATDSTAIELTKESSQPS